MIQKVVSNKKQHKASLLVVDDDPLVLSTLCLGLRDAGFMVGEATCGEEALQLCENSKFDLAVLDIGLPGLSGIETSSVLQKTFQIPFLFITAYEDEAYVSDAIKLGALGYLVKPININQIIPAIETALIRASDIKSLLASHNNLTTALSNSRETSIAIGIYMSHTSLSHQQAESEIRLYSRNTRQKMSNVAKNIIAASEQIISLVNMIQSESNHKNRKPN